MRIIFFGSGSPSSATSLRAIAVRHEVRLVVAPPLRLGPRDRLRKLFGALPATPLAGAARELRLPVVNYSRSTLQAVRQRLLAEKPDLLVISSFPAILPKDILIVPAINLHGSLLPRHRGADPLFWTYHADDRETGNTVHWATGNADEGDILAQQRLPLARGRAAMDLYLDLAERGGTLLVETIEAIDQGVTQARPQDPGMATQAPSPIQGGWRLEFDRWGAERTWHFISGTGAMYGAIYRDWRGEPLPLGGTASYETLDHGHETGAVERQGDRIRLYCADGIVTAVARAR